MPALGSGPTSAYGTIGRTQAADFKRLNESRGINGRKINLISVDDGYSPPKAVEQVRKLWLRRTKRTANGRRAAGRNLQYPARLRG